MIHDNKLKNAKTTVNILTEALPYIQRFNSKKIVIKYGGNAMIDEHLKNGFARDVILMKSVGMHPVIVHGGGPQIAELLSQIGKKSKFVDGMRVTDSKTMSIVEKVLGKQINSEIVKLINNNGGVAAGLSGRNEGLLHAEKMVLQGNASETIDLGYVGQIKSINISVIDKLIEDDVIPVVSPIGIGKDGQAYNINADIVAGKIAEALVAEKLIILTNAAGLLNAAGEVLTGLSIAEVDQMISEGTISSGMLPKIRAAMDTVNNGVKNAHIIDGRVEHAVLLEIFTDQGVGTLIDQHNIGKNSNPT